jgi:hypothetical protein
VHGSWGEVRMALALPREVLAELEEFCAARGIRLSG